MIENNSNQTSNNTSKVGSPGIYSKEAYRKSTLLSQFSFDQRPKEEGKGVRRQMESR